MREILEDPERYDMNEENFDDVQPAKPSDDRVLEGIDWNGSHKRRKKWLFMAAEVVRQANLMREKSETKQNNQSTTPNIMTSGATDIDWQSCYSQAACTVARSLSDFDRAQTPRSALQEQTFEDEDSDISVPVDVPREVLRRVENKIRNRDDVTVEEVITAHRKAMDWENQD